MKTFIGITQSLDQVTKKIVGDYQKVQSYVEAGPFTCEAGAKSWLQFMCEQNRELELVESELAPEGLWYGYVFVVKVSVAADSAQDASLAA